jgi:hypothetical protein
MSATSRKINFWWVNWYKQLPDGSFASTYTEGYTNDEGLVIRMRKFRRHRDAKDQGEHCTWLISATPTEEANNIEELKKRIADKAGANAETTSGGWSALGCEYFTIQYKCVALMSCSGESNRRMGETQVSCFG